MSDLEKDLNRAAQLCLVRPVAFGLAAAVVVAVMAIVGNSCYTDSKAIAAAVDTVRITDTVYRAAKADAAKAEKVSDASKATSDTSDQLVIIVSDTLLTTRATPTAIPISVTVPAIVTKDIADLRRTVGDQAVTIMRKDRALDDADSTIRARDRLIALLKPSPWGVVVSLGYGPQLERDGAWRLGWNAHVGLSYRIDLTRLVARIVRPKP